MARVPTEKATLEVDLRYPIKIENIDMSNTGDCFGKEYDITTKECPMCADNEVCAVVFMKKGLVDKVEKQREIDGVEYLDECRLLEIDEEEVYGSIESGVTKVVSIVQYLKKEGKTSDDDAVKEWIIRFKKKYNLTITQGIVWKK
jgi:hypothetical protein